MRMHGDDPRKENTLLLKNRNMDPIQKAKKVLIVDDSKVSRMIIRAYIQRDYPDWIVSEAENGGRAIEMADEDMPDYCTMDINMPGMLGTDAAQIILGKHPDMQIVIFSANIQQSQQLRAQALRVAFVAKPVNEKSIGQALAHFVSGTTRV